MVIAVNKLDYPHKFAVRKLAIKTHMRRSSSILHQKPNIGVQHEVNKNKYIRAKQIEAAILPSDGVINIAGCKTQTIANIMLTQMIANARMMRVTLIYQIRLGDLYLKHTKKITGLLFSSQRETTQILDCIWTTTRNNGSDLNSKTRLRAGNFNTDKMASGLLTGCPKNDSRRNNTKSQTYSIKNENIVHKSLLDRDAWHGLRSVRKAKKCIILEYCVINKMYIDIMVIC